MGVAQVVTMKLAHGRRWRWFAELNIVALSPDLDDAGRQQALDELQQEWRRTLRAVG